MPSIATPSDLPPPEGAQSQWGPPTFPWDLSMLGSLHPPTEPLPLSLSAHGMTRPEGPAPTWAKVLWVLCSPHSPMMVAGSSVYSVEHASIIAILMALRSHAFAHGVLKGRLKESGEIFANRVRLAWGSTTSQSKVMQFAHIVATSLKVGIDNLNTDDLTFLRAVDTWAQGEDVWREIKRDPTNLPNLIGGVKIAAEALKDYTKATTATAAAELKEIP